MTSSAPSRRGRVERPDALVGTLVAGKYRILSLVAKGGMGKIYRAEQQPLGRIVALKLLHVAKPRRDGDTQDSDADVSEKRFFREASILAKLQHPNIVTVYDFGSIDPEPPSNSAATVRDSKAPLARDDDDGHDDPATDHRRFFMAMEFLVGETLHDRLHARRHLSPDETVAFARQVARGLREAHALGIVHRDLKPLNLMIVTDRDGEEQIKILDFGIVKVVGGLAAPAQELTEEGLFVGSPMYMAPEQIETGKVDARSDVYSLGVVIYRCLCGQTPFPQGSTMQIMMAHLSEPPVPLRERAPETPGWLHNLVHRCLEKDPKRRPQSMDELLRALNEHAGVSSGNISLPAAHRPSFSGLSDLSGPILPPVDEHTVASGSSPTLTRSAALAAPRMPSSASPQQRRGRAWLWGVVALAILGVGIGGTLLLMGERRAPTTTTATATAKSSTTTAVATPPATVALSATSTAEPQAPSNEPPVASSDPTTTASVAVSTKPMGTIKPKASATASIKPPVVPTLDIQLKR
ncbi:MAG: protein kinase [Polyangiales bacterium]